MKKKGHSRKPNPLSLMLLSGVALLMIKVSIVECFPDGPPESACVNMRPGTQVGSLELEGHTALPQNQLPTYGNPRDPPFYFEIYPQHMEWQAGETYSVSVVTNQTTGSNHFTGILLQARTVECQFNGSVKVKQEALGSFSLNPDPSSTLLRLMECHDKTNAAVCHRSLQWKTNETVWWKAPETKGEEIGDIVFMATVVKSATIYWTNVHSGIMRYQGDIEAPTCAASAFSASLLAVFISVLNLLSS